jgi:hypothetical protein
LLSGFVVCPRSVTEDRRRRSETNLRDRQIGLERCSSGDYERWLKYHNKTVYHLSYLISLKLMYDKDEQVSYLSPPQNLHKCNGNLMIYVCHRLYFEKVEALYRFYIADDIVGNWKQFITSFKDAKSKLKDQKISEASYHTFIEECNGKIGFDTVKLRGNYIDPICYFGYLLTIQEHWDFLRLIENYDFQPDFKPFADVMLKQLATVTEFRVIPEIHYLRRNKKNYI